MPATWCPSRPCITYLQAIEFVQMQRDDELWELLISLALGNASLTGGVAPSSAAEQLC